MITSPSLVPVVLAILVAAPGVRAEEDDIAPSDTATAPQMKPQPPPYKPINLYSLLAHDDLVAELERRHLGGGTYPELVERVTRGLVGAPYLLSPLGESAMPDPDPRFRLDAFDCTTFVETAIALASCDELGDIERALDRVRYAGATIAFNERNHLMTAQWIPHLEKDDAVVDVTQEIGGKKTKWIELEMSRARWKKRRFARTLELPTDVLPVGKYRLPFIAIADVLALRDRVPPGTIMNIIRPDIPTSPEVVTHQGLIITAPGSKVRVVRHASPISKRVIDETLEHMMQRYIHSKDSRKWPIVGANFLRLVDPRTADFHQESGRAEGK